MSDISWREMCAFYEGDGSYGGYPSLYAQSSAALKVIFR